MNLTPEKLQELYLIPLPEMIGYSKAGEETFKAGWDAALNAVYSKVLALTAPEPETDDDGPYDPTRAGGMFEPLEEIEG